MFEGGERIRGVFSVFRKPELLTILALTLILNIIPALLLYSIGKRLHYHGSWCTRIPFLKLWMTSDPAGREATFFVILLLGTLPGCVVALRCWPS